MCTLLNYMRMRECIRWADITCNEMWVASADAGVATLHLMDSHNSTNVFFT